MALLTIKPSKGTIAFFATLVVVMTARALWNRREHQLENRDGPPAQLGRRLLQCIIGQDATRVLGPHPENQPRSPGWEARINDRLRRIAAYHYNEEWPARCVPLAQRLALRLRGGAQATAAVNASNRIAELLSTNGTTKRNFIVLVEQEHLGNALAQLADALTSLSSGSESGWRAPLPPSATDLFPVHTSEQATRLDLRAEARLPLLFSTRSVLYTHATDRTLFGYYVRPNNTFFERNLGVGYPSPQSIDGAYTLVSSDHGEDLLALNNDRFLSVQLPESIHTGTESITHWSAFASTAKVYFLGISRGQVLVRSAAIPSGQSTLQLPTNTEHTLGALENVAAATFIPGLSPEEVAIVSLRRTATGLSVHREAISPEGLSPSVSMLELSGIFDPTITVCGQQNVRYFFIKTATNVTVVRTDGTTAQSIVSPFPSDGSWQRVSNRAQCNAHSLVTIVESNNNDAAVLTFDFRSGTVARLPSPLPVDTLHTTQPTLLSATVSDQNIVIVLRTTASVRSFYLPDTTAHTSDATPASWQGGDLLSMLSVLGDVSSSQEQRTFRVISTQSQGAEVTILAEITEGSVVTPTLFRSTRNGTSWH